MKSYFKITVFLLLTIVLINCKSDTKLSEYKYSDKEFELKCENVDLSLIKEAVYSFEEDINNYYGSKGSRNLTQSYTRAINAGIYGRAKYTEIASEHTQEILKILKTDASLWKLEGKTKSLNYDHQLVKCLAENITNKELKTTFNALLSTNSMSVKLFGEAIRRYGHLAIRDKSLATYIALDMYYARLFDLDFDQEVNKKEPPLSKELKN